MATSTTNGVQRHNAMGYVLMTVCVPMATKTSDHCTGPLTTALDPSFFVGWMLSFDNMMLESEPKMGAGS